MTDPAAAPWTFGGESASLGRVEGTVTLVEETSFCLSGRSGDIRPGSPQGLFYLDTRLLSRWELRVDGHPPEPLSVAADEPFAATFAARSRPREGQADSDLMVLRRRYVGRGLREDLELRNYSAAPVSVLVELCFEVDFADLFAVKESRVRRAGEHGQELAERAVVFRHRLGGVERTVRVEVSGADHLEPGEAGWRVNIPAQGSWQTCLQVCVELGEEQVAPRYRCGADVRSTTPGHRMEQWRGATARLSTDYPALQRAFDQAIEDVGALRLFDPGHQGRPVVAAGAPWFMTVFGRDSLLTSYMALLADQELALGVLSLLARLQGERVDPESEEEPGRILHEIRFGAAASLELAAGQVYYGTADATPLFVVLLGECLRWGLPWAELEPLLPHADRALEWIERYGDRDGDGYVEYARRTDQGLANQGWKDSWDAIPFADGRLADPPIALAEVQGYVYAAYRARAALARRAGDEHRAAECEQRAGRLRAAFNQDFWLPDRGWFALALDGANRPVDALASNMGHCLWSGIVDPAYAEPVGNRLVSPELFSGWGIRTLATSMASYNPMSYHCGSVWPHDNAIIVAGLTRYGLTRLAQRVTEGLLAAAASQGGRLPELFAGLARTDVPVPVSYPTSCSPQAWSAAAPLLLLRSLLRLDPDLAAGSVMVGTALPEPVSRFRLDRVPLGPARVEITVANGRITLHGLPPGVELRAPVQPSSPA